MLERVSLSEVSSLEILLTVALAASTYRVSGCQGATYRAPMHDKFSLRFGTHSLALESLNNTVPLGDVVVNGLERREGLLGELDSLLVLEDGAVVGNVDLGSRSLEGCVLGGSRGVTSTESLELGDGFCGMSAYDIYTKQGTDPWQGRGYRRSWSTPVHCQFPFQHSPRISTHDGGSCALGSHFKELRSYQFPSLVSLLPVLTDQRGCDGILKHC
jgi:hypothetical protein